MEKKLFTYNNNKILKNNFNIETLDSNGVTALIYAINNKNISLINLLLQKGANIENTDSTGDTPLIVAINIMIDTDFEIIIILLEHGADIENRDLYGNTPLIVACLNKNIDLVKLLISRGSDINSYNNYFETSIFLVCTEKYFDFDMINYFIKETGANINGHDYSKNTPILELAKWNIIDLSFFYEYQPFIDNKIIQYLINNLNYNINNIFNKNISTEEKNTKNKSYYKIIIENIKYLFNYTHNLDWSESLILASEYEYLSIVHLLLDNNVNIEATNHMGETPLLIACRKCNYKMVKLLLNYKANIYCSDYSENTPFKNTYVKLESRENQNTYKKILYLLKKYKEDNINIIGSKKIGIIVAHGIIDKNRFCRIPDGINIFTEINKGSKLIVSDRRDHKSLCDVTKRRFFIKKPGKILKSGTIIHDIQLSFITGWNKSEPISNLNKIDDLNSFQYSGIITDNCEYKNRNANELNNNDKITEMFKYHNKDIISVNDIIHESFYLSEILNLIKKNQFCKDINTFILNACRHAEFDAVNKNERNVVSKLIRTNSSTNIYSKEFGNNLVNKLKLITNEDLITDEELNISSTSWGLGFLDETKKINYEKIRIINKLLNESYINIDEFRFILNIKNKKMNEININNKTNEININTLSPSNTSGNNYNISNIYNNKKHNTKKLKKLRENIKSENMNYEIYNKEKLNKNIENRIDKIENNNRIPFIVQPENN